MSTHIVEVCKIDNVIDHPNADRLSLAIVKGWQIVIKKEEYKTGDLAVFIPVQSIVPKELSDKYDFTQYLSNGRVKIARLRGEPSLGILIRPESSEWTEGLNVAEHFGITKYEPPVRGEGGFNSGVKNSPHLPPHPLFPAYTDIENLRHFNSILQNDEQVVITEKIHGMNGRVGLVDGEKMAGSRGVRRRIPVKFKDETYLELIWRIIRLKPKPEEEDVEGMKNDPFWFPWTIPQIKRAITELGKKHNQVIFYGEIYGSNIQKGFNYGLPTIIGFRAIDVILDGRYVDDDVFFAICKEYNIEFVPRIYEGLFDIETVKSLSKGKTTLNGAEHIREGVVVKPAKERWNPKTGRTIFKYISDEYLELKEKGSVGDFTEV